MADAKPKKVKAVDIATRFVKFYNSSFRTPSSRQDLSQFYRESSNLSAEGKRYCGKKLISEYLTRGIGTDSIVVDFCTLDVQDSGCGGMIIQVCGSLYVKEITNRVRYSQIFHIIPDRASKSFWIHNQILNLQGSGILRDQHMEEKARVEKMKKMKDKEKKKQ